MNVAPGSAFLQTVQGVAGGANGSRPASPKGDAADAPAVQRRSAETIEIQSTRQLRPGPPGTNLDIVV